MNGPIWPATWRMAWRGARHDRKRTMVVMALIAIPVAVAVIAGGVIEAGRLDPRLEMVAAMGQANLAVEVGMPGGGWVGMPGGGSGDGSDDGPAKLGEFMGQPDVQAVVSAWTMVRSAWIERTFVTDTGVGFGLLEVLAYDPAEAATTGMHDLRDGQWPTAGEVAITTRLAAAMDLAIGDEFRVLDDGPVTTVSGIIAHPARLDAMDVLAAPGHLAEVLPAGRSLGVTTKALVAADDPEAARQALVAAGEDAAAAAGPLPPDLRQALTAAGVESDVVAELSQADADTLAPLVDGPHEQLYATAMALAFDDAVRVTSRDDMASMQDQDVVERPATVGSLVAVALLAEVALIAGAAYAAGIRRRLRQIGLLSAQGASAGHVRRIVVGEAVAAGLLGATLGAAIGGTAVIAGRDLIEQITHATVVGVPLDPPAVLAPAVLGVVAAVAAAWVPARTASRVPTLTALQGRMPESRPPAWLTPVGIALVGFGAVLVVVGRSAMAPSATFVAATGVVGMIAGTAMLAGPLVAIVAGMANWLSPTPRLVLRNAARQRTRAAAAVAASMVVFVGPVVAATAIQTDTANAQLRGLEPDGRFVLVTSRARDTGPYPMPDPGMDDVSDDGTGQAPGVSHAVVDEVTTVLPEAVHAPISGYAALVDAPDLRIDVGAGIGELSPGSGEASVALATPELVAALGNDEVAHLVDAGTPVLLGVAHRDRTLVVVPMEPDLGEYRSGVDEEMDPAVVPDGIELDVVEVPAAVPTDIPRLVVDQETIDRLRLPAAPVGLHLFMTDQALGSDQAMAIRQAMAADQGETWVTASMPPTGSDSTMQTMLIMLAATLVVMAIVVGMVTALSAAESREELLLITAVGAAPSLRRRFLGMQTWLHVTLGVILAVPLGLLLLAVAEQRNATVTLFGISDGSIVVPWGILAVLVVAVPGVLALATAALVKSSLTQPPRRLA